MAETSRVNREIYARFCEGLGVKFPRPTRQLQKKKNTTKSRVRARVEHVFRVLKRQFGFDRVRYRGLAKNHNRLCACFALVNLYNHRKRVLVQRA